MPARLLDIRVSTIDASAQGRKIDWDWVETIGRSFQEIGQLQPIEVIDGKDGYRLGFGSHRLAAAQKIAWETIQALVWTEEEFEEKYKLRQRQISENLIRRHLSALDRAFDLAEWKAIYEAISPQAKRGGSRAGAGRPRENQGDKIKPQKLRFDLSSPEAALVEAREKAQAFVESFSAAAAKALGLSVRTIEASVYIAQHIKPDIRSRLTGSSLADSQSELLALAGLTPQRQSKVLDILLAANPSVSTVADAVLVLERLYEQHVRDKPLNQLIERFGRVKIEVRHGLYSRYRDEIIAWLDGQGGAS